METKAIDSQGESHVILSPPQELFPKDTAEVCEIVKAAAEQHVGLTPVSSQAGDGCDPCPQANGESVVVNFGKMSKIVRIDVNSRSAWIEAGVTFGQLIPALREQGLRLNMPLCPPAGKSVVASLLEREPLIIPKYQYDYIDPLLTMEIVYGTGDTLRTGSASGPGPFEKLKSDKVSPWGPGNFDFARIVTGAQGTLGFVTWAVCKAEIMPQLRKTFFVPSESASSLVSLANELLRNRVPDECLILDALQMSELFGSTPEDYPAWTLIACICGFDRYPEERVAIYEGYLHTMAADLELECLEELPSGVVSAEQVVDVITNCKPESSEPARDCRKLFFLCAPSHVAHLVDVMAAQAAKAGYPTELIGTYIQPIVQGRGCHVEFSLYCDDAAAGQAELRDALFTAASSTLMSEGAFFSRPYGEWSDMVYSTCPETVDALRKLKKIYDPDNILNPDKLCFGGM